MKKISGFTLIELLIVVAIIAILAAIAVPNFLEAQVRAKVSRVKSDQRSLATAIEAYSLDYNRPPLGQEEHSQALLGPPPKPYLTWEIFLGHMWSQVTTPIAYISSVPINVFTDKGKVNKNAAANNNPAYMWYTYQAYPKETQPDGDPMSEGLMRCNRIGASWHMSGGGPSRRDSPDPTWSWSIADGVSRTLTVPGSIGYPDVFYDPTNGTISYGHLVRSSKGIEPAS